MPIAALHFHTYFLFPFSVDKQAVRVSHKEQWRKDRRWLDGLDDWITKHSTEPAGKLTDALGRWRRDPYTRFDFDSQAYHDMVFFHPFMRRVFFDIHAPGAPAEEGLLRCYVLTTPPGATLWFEASELATSGSIAVTDLRLFMFANGMGILSIGVEARNIPVADLLWLNESLRKVYPSSGQQVREGRMPCEFSWVLEQNGARTVLVQDADLPNHAEMRGVLPPLLRTITAPLYFLDYPNEEFEPVLDERMVIHTYVALDPDSVSEHFQDSPEYQALLSRILYVDRAGDTYRYSPAFTREAMQRQMYTRWAHEGTYYGFTSYSSITVTLGTVQRHLPASDHIPLIHRMFTTRHYIMALVALFYRATLLDFSERTALVSRALYADQWDGDLKVENIKMTDGLRAEFLYFSSHWYFTELANKDEETEHFDLHCRQYRVEEIHREVAKELDALNASLYNYHQFRSTEALNRVGMLSLILGVGAVITGFFGMNFQIDPFTEGLLKGRPGSMWPPYVGIAVATLVCFGAILFGLFLLIANWSDYKDTLLPNRWRAPRVRQRLQKKNMTIS